jgi:hypothetical protein
MGKRVTHLEIPVDFIRSKFGNVPAESIVDS